MKRLTDKVAFITGGGSWIGKAIAMLFAEEGAKAFIVGREIEKLSQTIAEIKQAGGVGAYAQADISQPDSVKEAVTVALDQFGKIDILVQNAGIYPFNFMEHMQLSEWENVININLSGSFIVLQAIIATLKKQSAGRVIFISSIAGEEIGFVGFSHYTASKAGVNGLMRTAALELAKYNVTVNSIDAGNFLNEKKFTYTESEMQAMAKSIPLGRIGKPIDVANLALFLASDESSFITGQNLIIDGGETVQ